MRVLVILLVLTCGCYSFRGSSLPSHIRSLEIPVVENRTLEAVLAEELTTALTERFVADNRLRVVQRSADAVLEGVITGYENRVFGFNAQQQADEYVVILTVDMTLRDRVKNKEIWSEEGVRGVTSYFVGGPPEAITTELGAREIALRQVVDFALSRTVEGW
jgi:outer membrane lipopolysaccharide assembly protein LptE/RlpB